MRSSKTFLHDATFFSERYPPFSQQEHKEAFITRGFHYHRRLNATHGRLYEAVLHRRINSLNHKIDTKIEKISEPLQKIVSKIDKVDNKIEDLNAGIEKHNASIAKNEQSNSARSKTIVTNQKAKKLTKQKQLQSLISEKNNFEIQKLSERTKLKFQKKAFRLEQKANESISSLKDKKIQDSVNFAIAEVVLIFIMKNSITGVPSKKIAISFPILSEEKNNNTIFNFSNIPSTEDLFRSYCDVAQDNSYGVLEDQGLTLTGEGDTLDYKTCDDKYFPQVAFHTEKFFFYYLTNHGLKDILERQFLKKGLTPNNIFSIKALEIRMHSTRDMCRTCEPITIAEKHRLSTLLNQLLIERQYPQLDKDFNCAFIMSYSAKPRSGKIEDNPMSLKSKSIPFFGGAASRAHDYTFFASGGESQDNKAVKEHTIHQECVETIQAEDKSICQQREKKAAQYIGLFYKNYLDRKKTNPSCEATEALSPK